MEIWFGIVNGQNYLPVTHPYFSFRTITLVNLNGFSPNLICTCIDIMQIWDGIAHWQILSIILIESICLRHGNGGVYHFTFLFKKLYLLTYLVKGKSHYIL